MKKITLTLIFFIYFSFQLFSKEIQISNPIITDYYGCVYKVNLIIVYGNYGVINVSQDDGKTWKTQKIFDKGKIIKVFFVDNEIIAFNENGEIAKSTNNGRYFLLHSNLVFEENRRLLEVINVDDNYIVRSHEFVLLVNKNFEILKRAELPKLSNYYLNLNIQNTILLYKNKIFISSHKALIKEFDKELNLTKNLDFSFIDDSPGWMSIYNISKYLLMDNYRPLLRFNLETEHLDTLLEFYEPINKYNPYLKSVLNDKFIFLQYQGNINYKLMMFDGNRNVDSTIVVTNPTYVEQEYQYAREKINFITRKDNKYILVGEKNTIIIVETSKDNQGNLISETKEISKGYGFHNYKLTEPYRFDNSTIFTTGGIEGYDHFLYEISDSNNLIKPVIPQYLDNTNKLNTRHFELKPWVRLKNYNKTTNELNTITVYPQYGNGIRVYNTKDFFRDTISFYDFNDNFLDNFFTNYYYLDWRIVGTQNIFATHRLLNTGEQLSNVWFYSDSFKVKKEYTLKDSLGSNKKIEYLYTDNAKDFTLIYTDYNKNSIEFQYSNDSLASLNSAISLGNYTSIEKKKEVFYNGRKYFAYLTYNTENYNYTIEMFDVLNFQKYTLFEDSDDELFIENVNFDMYQDKIYISFGNKFMKLIGSIENPEWEEYSLPNNGMIDNYMYIQNNFLYCRYEDEKNELNLYRIEIVDSLVNSAEVDVNSELNDFEYVYLYEPYPNPTNNEINTEVFWSDSFDIENSDIGVFNINGVKISNPTNLTLEKLNANKGNIKWNCVGQPKGTYLIKIQHGNNTKTVKVVVN